jgi:hypothetical protein
MRRIAAISLFLATGCASTVTYVVPSQPSNVATLEFEKPANSSEFPFASGIYRIDESAYLRMPHAAKVFLAPGRHEIGVNCTQQIGTDEQPYITYSFAAGVSYVLSCVAGAPQIQQGLSRLRPN